MSNRIQDNINAFRQLLEDAMPNGKFDEIRNIVSKECITRRAGFANLFTATGAILPKKGNFLDWIEEGWKPLSEALIKQTVDIRDIIGQDNIVMVQYHMTAFHHGEFVGMPATNQRVEWDEVAVAHFNTDGKIYDLWFMCEELSLALQLGFKLEK